MMLGLTNLNDASSVGKNSEGVVKDAAAHWNQRGYPRNPLYKILEAANRRVRWVGQLIYDVHLAKGKRGYNRCP